MATHPACKPPARNRKFIKTKDFYNCLEHAKKSAVVVLRGRHGIGRRCTAYQVIRELMQQTDESLNRYSEIDCSAPVSAIEAIRDAYKLRPDLSGDQKSDRFSKRLLHTFQEINCADMHHNLNKYILLDVTKVKAQSVATDYLEHLLEEFFDEMNEEQKKKWTILVPVTKVDEIKPAQFRVIGEDNFITFGGFADVKNVEDMIKLQFEEEEYLDYAKLIHDDLRLRSPIMVNLIVKNLDSYESTGELFKRYTVNFSTTDSFRKDAFKDDAMVDHITRLSIDSCLEGSGIDVEHQKRFVAMLSLLDVVEVPRELLVAFVECLPYDPDKHEVTPIAVKMMMKLTKGDLCIRDVKRKGVFSIPLSFHETMGRYLDDFSPKERLNILNDVQIALIRRMPKDGRYCDIELLRCFYSHGVKVDQTIDSMLVDLQGPCNDNLRFTMRILQSELRAKIGYCLIALREEAKAEKWCTQALNLYYETVCGSYTGPPSQDVIYKRQQAKEFMDKRFAMRLYHIGQSSELIRSPNYQRFIKKLVRFHVLTENNQYYMYDVIEQRDMISEHLKLIGENKLLREGRVMHKPNASGLEKVADVEKLAKVYMGELLVNIYCTWSKLYLRLHFLPGIRRIERSMGECKLLADIAMEICGLVRKDHAVYLLQMMIASRNFLLYSLLSVHSYNEALDIFNKWDECGRNSAQSGVVQGAPTQAPSQRPQNPGDQQNQSGHRAQDGRQNPSDLTNSNSGKIVPTALDGSKNQSSLSALEGGKPPSGPTVLDGKKKQSDLSALVGGKTPVLEGRKNQSGLSAQDSATFSAGRKNQSGPSTRPKVRDGQLAGSTARGTPGTQQVQSTVVDPTDTDAFECGIVKCHVETDGYHKICCLMGKLLSLGKKHAWTRDRAHQLQLQTEGKKLMDDIKNTIEITNRKREETILAHCHALSSDTTDESSQKEKHRSYHSAMCKAHRVFAQYHDTCRAPEDAVKSIICSMEMLRLSTEGHEIDPNGLTFTRLLTMLDSYSSGVCHHFIKPDDPEAKYLQSVQENMKPLRGNIQQGGGPHMEKLESVSGKVVERLAIEDEQLEDEQRENSGDGNHHGAAASRGSELPTQATNPDDEYDVQYNLDDETAYQC